MANRITKKPKVDRQYELSQQAIVDTAVDQEGLPDVPAIALGPDIRPNQNRANIISKNDSDTEFLLRIEKQYILF